MDIYEYYLVDAIGQNATRIIDPVGKDETGRVKPEIREFYGSRLVEIVNGVPDIHALAKEKGWTLE